MQDLRADLAKAIRDFYQGEGLQETPIPGVRCAKVSTPGVRVKRCWHASLSIIVQGHKELGLDNDIYRSADAHYIATPIVLPVTSQTFPASPTNPFLALWLSFDPLVISEIASHLAEKPAETITNPLRAVFVGKAGDKMLRTALRLVELFQAPDDAPVLGALAVKEIFYHLLKGPDGPAILQFVRAGSKVHQISQAIHRLESELQADIDVNDLADSASMSRSAFFKCFKEITTMSPIQYQKRLRLLEARRLMADTGETAEGSAFKVGYRSASQFSREYSRMFGDSPLRDTMKIRETSATSHHGSSH